jgi:hypothetical protein
MYIMINHPNKNTRSRLCGGLEDAIYELGEVGHYGIEFKDTDGQMKETGVFFGGKSSDIESLAKIGIILVVRQLKEAIAANEKEALPFKEMHNFFMGNPSASSAAPASTRIVRPESISRNMRENGTGTWSPTWKRAGTRSALMRAEALLDYNLRRERIQKLTTALGACQRALSDSHVSRATTANLALT